MEERILTKADLDSVRDIEGFPIARDEDIIALSRPPYYTACPNPFIEDFIRTNGKPYDEATDDYHREPFASDVSEGKNDPIYMAHSYHTKVPHKAIMRYILHYTNPGDIVFDGFCGTGMTGVAAEYCGCADLGLRSLVEHEFGKERVQWGTRRAVLSDLSPAASFIAQNYNTAIDGNRFVDAAEKMLSDVEKELGWMYETQHVGSNKQPIYGIDGNPIKGRLNYIVWSDVFICPSCSTELVYWDEAVEKNNRNVAKSFTCPCCGSVLKKTDCQRAQTSYYDSELASTVTCAKQVPAMISYVVGKKKYEKKPDAFDLKLIDRISSMDIPSWYPTDMLPDGDNMQQPKVSHNFLYVHQYYFRRSLAVFSKMWELATQSSFSASLRFLITSVLVKTGSKFHNIGVKDKKINLAGQMPNVLFVPSAVAERNIIDLVRGKLSDITPVYSSSKECTSIISIGDAAHIPAPNDSIDYIFVDPPFGNNINYSELNFFWESWLKVHTNNQPEAIVNNTQIKGIHEYQSMMEHCFKEFYRLLKPNRWITIEFHNSQNAVWNAINEAILSAGFIIADIRVLDKQQGTFKQMTSTQAVKEDLVISAYKPRESFVLEFISKAGDPDMAWAFVRQHLSNLPIAPDANHDGKINPVTERYDYLLFDRMVAWHIMHGIPVPMDAHTFYDGLKQRFLQRDGMYFLPEQVAEYDEKRLHMELDVQQLSFLVTDEKNAIAWLNYMLSEKQMTYQELQPLYLQELHQSKKEKMPELLDMLKDNFLQDEKGYWYVPDPNKATDLAKLRTKSLVKEFYDQYAQGRGKLKVFRMEAIRAGFDDCWANRDYATIVAVGDRLPEDVLQEDPNLLMYYDNASTRVNMSPKQEKMW